MTTRIKSSAKRTSSFNIVANAHIKNAAAEKNAAYKKFLQKIIHPDYILFDWEYFSRELEFE